MKAYIEAKTVKRMANKAAKSLDAFRAKNPGGRMAQYVKINGMLAFLKIIDADGMVELTQDDYLALTQLP